VLPCFPILHFTAPNPSLTSIPRLGGYQDCILITTLLSSEHVASFMAAALPLLGPSDFDDPSRPDTPLASQKTTFHRLPIIETPTDHSSVSLSISPLRVKMASFYPHSLYQQATTFILTFRCHQDSTTKMRV
jgi:hypothetical protein